MTALAWEGTVKPLCMWVVLKTGVMEISGSRGKILSSGLGLKTLSS